MLRALQTRVSGSLRVQLSRMVSSTVVNTPALEDEVETDSRIRSERCLNRITLIGRAGKEPEQRGNAEHPCLVFPLATNIVHKKADGERVLKTDWHRVVVFRPGLRDAVASRIVKGDRLFVEGSISYSKFNDAENRPVNVVSITADTIMFLNRRKTPNQAEEEDQDI